MFEIPLLLGGLLFAGIPVIIHMMHRSRTTPLDWGAMMFLQASDIVQKKRRDIEHWLLLLLRMALLALLAILLAKPLLPVGRFNPLSGNASSDVVVVLDHSVSSGFIDGKKTLFQRSIDVVQQIAACLRPSDTLSVILAQRHPVSLTRQPVSAADSAAVNRKLLDVLRNMPQGLTGSSIPKAIAFARHFSRRGVNYQKIIFVISGQQRVSWQVNHPVLWRASLENGRQAAGKYSVFDLPVQLTQARSDVSIGALHVQPALPGVGHPAEIFFSVANSGPLPLSTIPLVLNVNGSPVDRQTLPELNAGQTQTVVFKYRFQHAGSHWLKVSTPLHDALAADNSSLAAVRVWQRIRVLVVDSQLSTVGTFRASRFIRAALNPFSSHSARLALADPHVVSVQQAATEKLHGYDAIVVNDASLLPEQLMRRIYNFAHAGGGVWFIFGRRTDPNVINHALATGGFALGRLLSIQSSAHSPAILIADQRSRLVRPLAILNRNGIVGVTLTKWWNYKITDPAAKVVLATGTGDPLLISRPIGTLGGQVALSTFPVDGHWNDWPTRAGSFVPLVNQIVDSLALGKRRFIDRHYLNSGDTLIWTGPSQPAVTGATIVNPTGRVQAVVPQLTSQGRYLVTWNKTDSPGLYTLHLMPAASHALVYYAVGLDAAQLSAKPMNAGQKAWLLHNHYIQATISAAGISRALGAVRSGTPLWPLLALLVLLMLVAEVLWCRRMARLAVGGDAADAGLPGHTLQSFAQES